MVRRSEREDLHQIVDRSFRIARAVLRHGSRFVQQLKPRGLLAGGLDDLVVQLQQLVPASLDRELQRDAVERPARRRIDLEHAVQQGKHVLRIVQPLIVILDGAIDQVEREVVVEVLAEHLAVGSSHVRGPVERACQLFQLVPMLALIRRLERLPHRGIEGRVGLRRSGGRRLRRRCGRRRRFQARQATAAPCRTRGGSPVGGSVRAPV